MLARNRLPISRALARGIQTTALRASARKANTDYLQPTHLDDAPSKAVADKLAKYAQVTLATYARPPFILTKGSKCSIWDSEGREYLDFSGGIAVNALGHADAGVAKVLAEQSQKLVHNSNLWHNEHSGELALLLANSTKQLGGLGFTTPAEGEAVSPTGLKVFFSNSGTEANEGALKFARKWGKLAPKELGGGEDKVEIVSFKDGFHGRSMGALSATWQEKYQKPFAPLIPGFKPATLNDVDGLKDAITDKTCGVIVEPIQVRTSSTPPPPLATPTELPCHSLTVPLTSTLYCFSFPRAREVSSRRLRSSSVRSASGATRLARSSSSTRSR